jgi:hypothetical protein
MADEHFDEEFDRVMKKVMALEKEVAALKGAQSRVTLTSPKGRFQIALELFDTGLLQALLWVKQPNGTYKQQPSEKKITQALEQQTMKGTWYLD